MAKSQKKQNRGQELDLYDTSAQYSTEAKKELKAIILSVVSCPAALRQSGKIVLSCGSATASLVRVLSPIHILSRLQLPSLFFAVGVGILTLLVLVQPIPAVSYTHQAVPK